MIIRSVSLPGKKAFPLRATKCGAGVNDSPVGCQSRAVTEPQRDGGTAQAVTDEVEQEQLPY